jgi:deoxyribonuclease V
MWGIILNDIDLYQYTYDLVRQIPSGNVSSYGEVAKSLGDIRASRAVGRMMNQNPDADAMPCFKIVQSDGHLGGFGLGLDDKIRRLNNDLIQVKNNEIVDFDNVLFTDFQTDYPLQALRKQQQDIASKVKTTDLLKKQDIRYIAGFDVAYPYFDDWKKSVGACVVYDMKTKEIVEQQTYTDHIMFPYIPTYLSFREYPFIEKLYQSLTTKPSVLLTDGNGILHPIKCGLACFTGVSLQMPTIGVAKSQLCGALHNDNTIELDNEIVGYAYSAHSRIKKPVYISPGHMISLETSINIIKQISKYKQPEPLRQAHNLATETLRGYQ